MTDQSNTSPADWMQMEADRKKLREMLEETYKKYGLDPVLSEVIQFLRDAEPQPLPGQLESMAEAPIVHATVELGKALQMERHRRITDTRTYPF
jgi:hypothetical protein